MIYVTEKNNDVILTDGNLVLLHKDVERVNVEDAEIMHIDCIKETVRGKVTSANNVLLEEVELPVKVDFFIKDTS